MRAGVSCGTYAWCYYCPGLLYSCAWCEVWNLLERWMYKRCKRRSPCIQRNPDEIGQGLSGRDRQSKNSRNSRNIWNGFVHRRYLVNQVLEDIFENTFYRVCERVNNMSFFDTHDHPLFFFALLFFWFSKTQLGMYALASQSNESQQPQTNPHWQQIKDLSSVSVARSKAVAWTQKARYSCNPRQNIFKSQNGLYLIQQLY